MGPKKEKKESFPEPKSKDWLIDDPINTDSWRCVVTMGVERTFFDSYAMKEFTEESVKGRRQDVSVIDFETLVLKILNDFANGELPYKYKFLMNFSSMFQEAVHYIKNKHELPTAILAKIVKVLLLNIKEDCATRFQSIGDKIMDPIKVMTERPSYIGDFNDKKKDMAKKGGHGLKLRPPSATKLDTNLLKRGERAKDDQCIDDAPRNAYFHHYILLTSFYNPEFPLELIKAGIPLHGVLCIDTTRSGIQWDTSATIGRLSRRNTEIKARDIHNFWSGFLKKIWDPTYSHFFRDTVFQMYVPQKLQCDRETLRKFLYKEISYLMYDLSDLKRQLNNYLSHIRLCSVDRRDSDWVSEYIGPDNIPNECVNSPVILQCIINSICSSSFVNCDEFSLFSGSEDSEFLSQEVTHGLTPSMQATHGSCYAGHGWELDLEERGDYNLLNIYYKIKELDIFYDLDKRAFRAESDKILIEIDNSDESCKIQPLNCCENLEKALMASDSIIHTLWKKYKLVNTEIFSVDYCLYANLMTKVQCSYMDSDDQSTSTSTSCTSNRKNYNFEAIENLGTEMRKPHFTVTDGSRSIIKCIPYNLKSTSRDFFCPDEFKIVSPAKLKASSAPQFRTPSLKVKALYASEIFTPKITSNPYESLKGFVSDCIFSQTVDYDCIEFLSRSKLLEVEKAQWSNYNCIDHTYCLFSDCILLMIHNRKDGQNFQHETFNQKLRTSVGLRDFYDYVQEDEAEWLELQEESYQAKVFLSNKVLESNSLKDFTDSDFWLADSLKSEVKQGMSKRNDSTKSGNEVKIAYSSDEKIMKPVGKSFEFVVARDDLEGYELNDMAVQYSGLKTVYLADDCSVAVQLIERLYGTQELGVHVTEAAHTLHLYSYVCPEPHLQDPFTFHITFKNGIIVAFSRRLFEIMEHIEASIVSSETVLDSLRTKSASRSRSLTRTKSESENKSRSRTRSRSRSTVPKIIKDEDFWYDLAASLPNGLCIRIVRKHVKPCYIKQYYIGKKNSVNEKSRLFLPNGEVIKMMNDNTVQILKPSSSIITAKLKDLIKDEETQLPVFTKYEILSEEGIVSEVEGESTKLTYRYQVFHNKDSSNNRTFFRRRDGSNYMLESDGSLCIAFKDGTKMQTTLFFPTELQDKADEDFVIVHMEVIVEHPNYATVTYNSETMRWKILLPSDASFEVRPEGFYSVNLDRQTVLNVEADLISLDRSSESGKHKCSFRADLSVFESKEDVYCKLRDPRGKTFVVQKNSNCYVTEWERNFEKISRADSPRELSESLGSTNLRFSTSTCKERGHRLYRENKYVAIRRDYTGMEVLHIEDVNKVLKNREKGSLLFIQNLPGTENRCFVLISPVVKKSPSKWRVSTILPSPVFERNSYKQTISSTYGVEVPPTWMHPFPKKKKLFVVPEPLTCRVFIETKKTKLSPSVGSLDCYFCTMDELTEIKYSQIPPKEVDSYLKKLANDNQQMLKEMYSLVALSIINEKKKLVSFHTEKLERYLKNFQHRKMMSEYYKKCIRYHIIPKYFDHPEGMSWYILHDLVNNIKLSKIILQKSQSGLDARSVAAEASVREFLKAQSFSNTEIEYDLSVSDEQSYSDLSYRSNLPVQTAPAILRNVSIRCAVKPMRNVSSSPEINCLRLGVSDLPPVTEGPRISTCAVQKYEIEKLEKPERVKSGKPPMSLEDLMYLGLI